MGKVTYEKDMHAKAKSEGLTLVTLDIFGKYAKRDGVTYQGYLFTPGEVEEVWKFFMTLATNHKKRKAKGGGKK